MPPDPASSDDYLYEIDEHAVIVPSRYAQGPWDPHHQHGGAVVALFSHLVEQVPTAVPMRVARLTVDLYRPVPMSPLRSRYRIVRQGKRIQLVDVMLDDGDVEVARVSALSLHTTEVDVPEEPNRRAEPRTPPPRGGGIPFGSDVPGERRAGSMPGFVFAFEGERVAGAHGGGVPAVSWFRLRCGIVAGRPVTPLGRAAAASDFVSGLATFLDFRTRASINPDVSLHLLRPPVDEWIGLDASYQMHSDGIAQTRAFMFDQTGHMGTVLTSAMATILEPPV